MKSRMNEAFFSFFACSQRRAASGPIKAYMSLSSHLPGGGWKNHKIGIGCIPRRAAGKALYNTALTDGHLILTAVFPQMEMFFLLPALRCDEVVGLLFVTRSDVLRISCLFVLSGWDCLSARFVWLMEFSFISDKFCFIIRPFFYSGCSTFFFFQLVCRSRYSLSEFHSTHKLETNWQ